jgi:hypothetical protein
MQEVSTEKGRKSKAKVTASAYLCKALSRVLAPRHLLEHKSPSTLGNIHTSHKVPVNEQGRTCIQWDFEESSEEELRCQVWDMMIFTRQRLPEARHHVPKLLSRI